MKTPQFSQKMRSLDRKNKEDKSQNSVQYFTKRTTHVINGRGHLRIPVSRKYI